MSNSQTQPKPPVKRRVKAVHTKKVGTVVENKKQKFFKKLFSPITKVLDGVETDFTDSSRPKKTLISMFKLKVPICIILVVAIFASALYFMFESNNVASTEMSLNYVESAYGLNPNSTRFNVSDIESPEVVSNMLTYCGIDPESVDLQSVIENITVTPVNNKAFSEEEEAYYITSTYKITLKKPSCIKGVSTDELLTFLCKAYKDNLYMNYTENRSILEFDIEKFNDKEYLEIADLLDLKAQQLEKYLNTRVKQGKTFTDRASNETFKSLSKKLDDLRNYDISRYRSYVIESGCSHDKASYIRSLSYINRMKGITYSKDMAGYIVHNQGIKMYDEAMISVVMIPSIDESKNTYYMSKTKTGMDYMASKADSYLATAQATAKEISVNKEIMAKMNAGKNTKPEIDKADTMISKIRDKFSDLSRLIESIDKAFIKYKTKDYLTFKDTNPSIMQKFKVDSLFVIAVALVIVIYAAIWVRFRFFKGGNGR